MSNVICEVVSCGDIAGELTVKKRREEKWGNSMEYHRIDTGEEVVLLPLKPDIRKIYVEVTTNCNYTCITCIRHSWSDADGHLPWTLFAKMLQDMKALPELQEVHFGGFGEPLTHPMILDMIRACHQAGYRTEMITNGSLLTEDMARSLIQAGLDWIFVSLDGSDDHSFAEIRPGASYREVTDNIRRLQRLKKDQGLRQPELGIEFVATRQNFARLPEMRKVVDELDAHRFIVTNLLPYHESMKDEILYDRTVDMAAFGGESVLLSVKSAPNMQLRTQRNCRFVEGRALVVTTRGKVSPCYAFVHSHSCYILGRKKEMLAHDFGDLSKRSLGEIWQDREYALFRWMVRNGRYPSCTDCRMVEGCAIAQNNEADCWGNAPTCGDCLWSREIIVCP